MSTGFRKSILISGMLTLFAVVACTGGGDDPTPNSPRLVFATPTISPQQLSLDDITEAAKLSGVSVSRLDSVERSDDGIVLSIAAPKVVEVGGSGWALVRVTNVSENFKPEKPFSISQASGSLIPGGPISVEPFRPPTFPGAFTLAPGETTSGSVNFTCNEEGPASLTYQSTGTSEIENPPDSYSTTVDWNFECVLDDGDPLNNSEFTSLTDGALGFSQGTLTWVTFDQGGVILRVNQIQPSRLAVGESVEIYADFDARVAAGYSGFGASRDRLTDGEINFTSGGPVSIESPPQRVADPAVLRYEGDLIVLWGFRAGTLTCNDVGEGVYHANLVGTRFDGQPVKQTVSGLVDCVEESNLAADLDFTGTWARRPMPGSAYTPTGRDEFPNNTELYYDRQLCVARVDGIRACDVAYWIYAPDWLELTRHGDAIRSVDESGNEEFVSDYTAVYHHTHSYFARTEIPDDLLRNGKGWGDAWDLGAGPTDYTFTLTGTISFSPERSNSLLIRLTGEHEGDLPYTHGSKINISYSGTIPASGELPVNVGFTEEVRRPEHAPEGMYRGSDNAYRGTFFAASVSTNGAIAGTVRPASAAQSVDQAKVEVFLPGGERPIATANIDSAGKFLFKNLPIVRTDDSTAGASDVYASQYKIKVSEAESEVDGLPLLFKDKIVTARPFVEQEIFLEPTPATHFIAVGDRGVAGTPIVFHYSLEYWICGGRFDPLHFVDGFTPEEIVKKCWELNPRARPQKLGAVELLARTDYTVWAGVDDLLGDGRSWMEQSVWIAEIVYKDIAATELMPIYAGTEEEVTAKWNEIIQLAQNYPWAEQTGFASNGFTKWPMSMYDPLGTNSNTFIRYLVTSSGLRMTEMDGSHPGNDSPVQNTESDLGRLLTFYAAHTPWSGDNAKPEPTGAPP